MHREFSPSGFFVLRTPLYPYDRLAAWADGAGGREGVSTSAESRLAQLRAELRAVFDQPEAREALLLASPSLFERLELYDRDPSGDRGRKIEFALLRYFVRMTSRATPFGLFAGCTLGGVGEKTRFELSPAGRARRHARLDMHYICALVEALQQDAELRRSLRYRPNSSLYRMHDRFHYAQWRPSDNGRTYELVVVEASEYLEATLERAAAGATATALAEALVRADAEIEREEADAYLDELIDSQILVAEIEPRLTGDEPLPELIERLEKHAAGRTAAATLRDVQSRLTEIDAQPPGVTPQAYRDVAERLSALPAKVELSRLFQVDLYRPAVESSLGPRIIQDVLRGVDTLRRFIRGEYEPLARFREAFRGRYEEREVPLVEVLDEEVGIGFDTADTVQADVSPLLAGLDFPQPDTGARVPWGRRESHLLTRLTDVFRRGATELKLDDADLKALTVPDPPPAPDAFAAMIRLEALSGEDADRGDYRLLLELASGPSGALMLGRFCHGDPELEQVIRRHLADEEAHRPEAVYAEVVHLSEGRLGNVVLRPLLRRYEIPYQGVSGAPAECQIPITDLYVSVVGGRIVLKSRRLEREIVPRLTNAHNFNRRSLGIYRFLCSLQSQGVSAGMSWRWGALESAPVLPRVSWGRLVLARARWRMTRREIEKLTSADRGRDARATPRPDAVAAWRAERGLPRYVVLSEADNELLIDLDNPLCVEMFLGELSGRSAAMLVEPFPAPGQSPVRGPDGAYANEFVIPFVRNRAESPQTNEQRKVQSAEQSLDALPPASRSGPPVLHSAFFIPHFRSFSPDSVVRTLPPGSAWLYAKLYTGYATADRVLSEAVRPLVDALLRSGAADRWFFLRYGDPDWHLRLRLRGDPARLHAECLPRLQELAASLLAEGRIRRLALDTYDREVERYGGPEGVEPAEELFCIDSEAALAIVESLEGDEAADARWRLALRGTHLLLEDFGFDLEQRCTLMKRVSESFLREHSADAAFRRQLAARFRQRRAEVDALLEPQWSEDDLLAPGFEILARRSAALRPVAERLREQAAAGRLVRPLADLVASFAHMHVNRVLRSAHRAQEVVIYFLLERAYDSQRNRTRSEPPPQSMEGARASRPPAASDPPGKEK